MDTTYSTRQPRTDTGFLMGLLAGAAVGGGLALLFAPQEGADTRHALAARGQQAGRRISDAYGTVAAQARRRARALTTRASRPEGRPEGSAPGAHPEGQSTLVAGHTDDRSANPVTAMGEAVRELTYAPTPVAPNEPGPGTTSPAPARTTWPQV